MTTGPSCADLVAVEAELKRQMTSCARCLERIAENTVFIAEQTVFVVIGLFRELESAAQLA
jgi:phosphate uptake regulator